MLGPFKKRMRDKLLNMMQASTQKLEGQQQELTHSLQNIAATQADLVSKTEPIGHISTRLAALEKKLATVEKIALASYDGVSGTTPKVEAMRKTPAYKKDIADKQPLISIRIATYNRSQTLIDKAVASILKQTYQNFEVVIVGDHCTDDTAEKVKALEDPRFSFYNLPTRTVYPEDRIEKWLVIGAPAMNAAAGLAKGAWIAPIDDDDEFTPNHLQTLLDVALKTKSELVYGAMNQHNLVTGEDIRIWAAIPAYGQISLNGAMYLSQLDAIFKYDIHSYMLEQPADWTMVRRMMESGVRMSGIDEIVGVLNMIPPGHDKKDY
jgi:hypothetical protein